MNLKILKDVPQGVFQGRDILWMTVDKFGMPIYPQLRSDWLSSS